LSAISVAGHLRVFDGKGLQREISILSSPVVYGRAEREITSAGRITDDDFQIGKILGW
jgi:hypothetical protein